MIPVKINWRDKAGNKCEAYGSYIKNEEYYELYSFEGNHVTKIHEDKIDSIEKINLNE